MKKAYKQVLHWRGIELKYRIGEPMLRQFGEKSGRTISECLGTEALGTIKILYYCICWGAVRVSLESFLADYRLGRVEMFAGRGEYGIVGINRLIVNAARKYRIWTSWR